MSGPAHACQSSKQTVEEGGELEGKEAEVEEETEDEKEDEEEGEGEGWFSKASSTALRSIPIKPTKSKDAEQQQKSR